MKTFCILTSLIAYAAVAACGFAADNAPERASVTIQSVAAATKGFPCVMKLTVRGPAYVPNASLRDELASIRLQFTSISNGQIYRVASSRGMDTEVMTPEGVRLDHIAERMWQVAVEKGEQRSILLDVASLRPELGRGSVFYDVPPGEYDVTIDLPGVSVHASTIRMRVVAPNDAEKRFLAEILRQGGAFRRKKGVNWSKVLRAGISLPEEEWSQLPENTQKQVGLHMLLSRLRSTEDPSAARQKVESMPLPEFLVPEKECLLLEIAARAGQHIEDEASRLMKEHPDLEWRLKQITSGEGTLLRSSEINGRDDK